MGTVSHRRENICADFTNSRRKRIKGNLVKFLENLKIILEYESQELTRNTGICMLISWTTEYVQYGAYNRVIGELGSLGENPTQQPLL